MQKQKLSRISSLIVIILMGMSIIYGLFFIPQKTSASSVTVSRLIYLTNQERAKYGLPSLQSNHLLTSAAQSKAKDMVQKDYFEHKSPNGWMPWDWIENVGYHYVYAGENLAKDFYSSEEMMVAWMKSSTHRANILNSHYEDIGIAVISGEYQGYQTLIAVSMFGSNYYDSSVSTSVSKPKVSSASLNKKVKKNTPVIRPENSNFKKAPKVISEPEFSVPKSIEKNRHSWIKNILNSDIYKLASFIFKVFSGNTISILRQVVFNAIS